MQTHSVWTAGAADWAELQEPQFDPAYRAVLDVLEPWAGVGLLDVGCGTGRFAALARERGATVAGADGSAAMVALARHRLPEADLRAADMARLPWDSGAFDVVTGFNSFQFAADPVAALAEAARLARPGGRVLVAVLGPRAQSQTGAVLAGLRASLPSLPAGGPDPFALSEPGQVEQAMTRAGLLAVGRRQVVACPWGYADLDAALRGLLSGGPAGYAVEHLGTDAVAGAAVDALAPFRRPDGGYLLGNTVHYVVGTPRKVK
jgi:SAM-dependent methyltransferase